MDQPQTTDVFTDQFVFNLNAYGCALSFLLSVPAVQSAGMMAQPKPVATIRMSLEHLKMLTFLLRREILGYENKVGIQVQIPQEYLIASKISGEDWDTIWKQV